MSKLDTTKIYTSIVKKGKQVARQLGSPTANIIIETIVDPGVYSGQCFISKYNKSINSCIFIDQLSSNSTIIEVYCIDETNLELYNEEIKVSLNNKIRDKYSFDSLSLDQIKQQIQKDINQCRYS